MVKNEKERIFELKIDEDELSGVDAVSLVDEPAINIGWVAFKKDQENFKSYSDYPESVKNNAKAVLKWVEENGWGSCGTPVGKARVNQLANGEPISEETIKRMYSYLSRHEVDLESSKSYDDGCGKLMYDSWGGKTALNWSKSKINTFSKTQEDFHIPDGEDQKYIDMLLALAEDEDEMLAEGWELVKVEDARESFTLSPNEESDEDFGLLRVRYKYGLNPNIKQNKIIATTRDFCKSLVNKNYVWRSEDIESLRNDFGQSAQVWRGGYNCRHQWFKMYYKATGTIINKASVQKNKVTVGGFDIELSPDWLQPDTVTNRTAANPSTKTMKNLGLSKEAFEVGVPHYTADGKLYEGPMHKDASGRLMTGAVHTADSEYLYHKDELGYDNSLPQFTDPNIKKKPVEPSIAMKIQTDDEKRIVLGPAMVPDLKIFRKDELGNPYYVYFSAPTIEMIAEKYFKNKFIDNNDRMHDGKALEDVYVVESWIKQSDNDKSTDYGYKDLPVGTWFISMKINNDEVWNDIKAGKLTGYSVSGYFEQLAKFMKEELFLQKVADILKNI